MSCRPMQQHEAGIPRDTIVFHTLRRGDAPEILISGVLGLASGEDSESLTILAPEVRLAARSLIKPWFALARHPDIPLAAWGAAGAMALASPSGSAKQVDALGTLASHLGLEIDSDLEALTPCMPLDLTIAADLTRRRIHHPCCGKHLVVAASERIEGSRAWQDRLVQLLARHQESRSVATGPSWAQDSCGLPTWVAPTADHLRAWHFFGTSRTTEIDRLRSLMLDHADLIGGPARLDTELMLAGQGQILAKEGADGLLVIHTRGISSDPSQTVLLKLWSGYSEAHLRHALAALPSCMARRAQGSLHPALRKAIAQTC